MPTPALSILLLFVGAVALLLLFLWRARRRNRALLATIGVVVLPGVTSEQLGNSRDITVYLPPTYAAQPQQRYPVLYVNDGQDMAALQLRATLAELFSRGKLRPLIAVAIPTNENRLQEYGTAVAPNAQGFGRRAAAYSRFIIEELMPLINSRFRTLNEAGETAFLGASLGGLSAFDVAWSHRSQVGIVGVLSGSFWWRAAETTTDDEPTADRPLSSPPSTGSGQAPLPRSPAPLHPCPRPGQRIAHETVRCSTYRPGFRAWFEAGTRDETSDRDNNGVIDAIQDTLELIEVLEQCGYRLGRDLAYVEVEGGRHDYETWASVLPDFLQWAF
jgi:enterochelin esterase-like enzyme